MVCVAERHRKLDRGPPARGRYPRHEEARTRADYRGQPSKRACDPLPDLRLAAGRSLEVKTVPRAVCCRTPAADAHGRQSTELARLAMNPYGSHGLSVSPISV